MILIFQWEHEGSKAEPTCTKLYSTAVKYQSQDSKLKVMTTKLIFFPCYLLFAYINSEVPAEEETGDKARK